MTLTNKPLAPLRALLAASAASAALFAAVPAHAGPFDFLKRTVEREVKEAVEGAAETAVETALQTAVETTFKVEKAGQAQTTAAGFRQEGGTTVPTADDIAEPATDDGEAHVSGVFVASGDVNGDGIGESRGKPFRQEGHTTVPTADDVQAPAEPGQRGLLLPAIQRASVAAPPARARMSQNGTTVETASEVQAQTGGSAGQAHNPKNPENVQASDAQRDNKPQRAKMRQNGTTVATAAEVQAPSEPR